MIPLEQAELALTLCAADRRKWENIIEKDKEWYYNRAAFILEELSKKGIVCVVVSDHK